MKGVHMSSASHSCLEPLSVRRFLRLLAFLIAITTTGSSGVWAALPPTTLTFDDLPPPPVNGWFVPDGYGGLDWDNIWSVAPSGSYYAGSGYENGRISGDWVAYNGFANPGTIYATLFDLNSAYFTGAWSDSLNITVRGFHGGIELYTTTFAVDHDAPLFVDFSWSGLDMVTLDSFGGTDVPELYPYGEQFVMDNLTVTVTIVPEATTFSLLALGSLALVMARHRR